MTNILFFKVNELKRHRGNNERECVFQICHKIFGIDLARNCSLKGKNNNFKLEGTQVLDVIKGIFNFLYIIMFLTLQPILFLDAVIANYSDLNMNIFNGAITDWFRNSELRFRRAVQQNKKIKI